MNENIIWTVEGKIKDGEPDLHDPYRRLCEINSAARLKRLADDILPDFVE